MTNNKLTAAVAAYFADLQRVRASGGGTGERSSYAALANLLNAVGAALKPKVFCVAELADQGAGHPDLGLYAARQVQKGRPRPGQAPERGVVEVKSPQEDVQDLVASEQVYRYLARYGLVLATNLREFALVGPGASGGAALETFRLAGSADDFHRKLERPRAFAGEVGAGLGEYLCRALSHQAALAEPKDLAWLLASYARDGLARVEAAGDAPSLEAVRKALEEALGVRFKGEKGARFFRSTLVQTLFYGVFSAWVLWARADAQGAAGGGGPSRSGGGGKLDAPNGPRKPGRHPAPLPAASPGAVRFHWREAVWHLRVPVLAALFQQLAAPGRLQPLGLVEVLDWTAAALDRVDHAAFFARFNEGEAVPYFYEPFLEAFDPGLRKQLGVWYTPSEVVRYMVARVDLALKQDLGIADGLAAENVYVLDPCCGTGAYLAEVLRRIAANLEGRGLGALAGARVKQAATERVFGFEIMPAPFVVAHLQVGLTLRALDAPLADGAAGVTGEERPGVFLTNALTGWEPKANKPLPFPELEEERDRAERVKRDAPILVILGNPPYNGFAGMAVDEERALSDAYRDVRRVRRPEGQGLNDLYVRFFRMAERRIAEKTGRGVVCFISNYSWLDGLSFTGMRERYLEAFDAVRIDCLNGDKYKTGKVAPDGSPDPSIFSTEGDLVGIQVGTAIAMLVRKGEHVPPSTQPRQRVKKVSHASEPDQYVPAKTIGFRHLWGQMKREALLETAEAAPDVLYEDVRPVLPLGLPFVRTAVSEGWFDWPSLPDLFPTSFPGVKTSRDGFLVDVDLGRLKARMADYFNADLSHEEIAQRHPSAMRSTARFDARAVREALLSRGGPTEDGFVRYAYRPFDVRWLYWEADTKLLDEKRSEYRPHVFEGNLWIEAREREAKEHFARGTLVRNLADNFGNGLSSFFPIWLRLGDAAIELDDAAASRRSSPNVESHPERGPHPNDDDRAQRKSGLNVEPSEGQWPHRRVGGAPRQPNLSEAARKYLERLGMNVEDLFHHVLATLHDPAYREANAGALRMEWPRIPLPGWSAPGTAGGAAGFGSPALPSTSAGKMPALPGGAPAYAGHDEPTVERALPGNAGVPPATGDAQRPFHRIPESGSGNRASGDADAPPADESNANAIEPRTGPSGQVGGMEAAEALAQSAARGRQLAALLDPDTPVPGVTTCALRPELAAIAVPTTADGRNMAGDDFALTAGWGHIGAGGAVMPGQGRAEERPYTKEEQAALGAATFDIHLNDRAYWRNVPAAVWNYKLGGYQVLKKWLSYRERSILNRPLLPEEVQHFTDTARRIAAILLC